MIELSDIENILRVQHATFLETMVSSNFNRITLSVFKVVRIDYPTQVYGLDAGEEGLYPAGEIIALVAGDSFFPSDLASAGTLTEGWLFTTSTLLGVGDLVALKRSDERTRRYKVVTTERVGSSQSVFTQFKLSAIAD